MIGTYVYRDRGRMEYGGLVQNAYGSYGSFSDILGPETDFIDELFVEGCWLETRVGSYLNCGTEANSSKSNTMRSMESTQIIFQQEESLPDPEISLMVGKRWWIGPRENPGPSSSVKERLVIAVGYLKEYAKNSNLPIQVWVPERRSARAQPQDNIYPYAAALLNGDAAAFQIQEDWVHVNDQYWTPNVRFFRSHEYPRHLRTPGSLALPVFERGTAMCLGVVEILMPNNPPDLQCTVDFTSSTSSHHHNFIPPAVTVKGFDELYQSALNGIVQVLTCVCKAHNLPLALTWAPCIQQAGKSGCGHSNDEMNYVSTVYAASFVADVELLGFLEACSECHLLGGQGVVGTAFTTTKPCFANDITSFSKAEYPLAHHANMFGLHAALGIPLRSASADFVLEFFLPKDCHDTQDQKQLLNSLFMLVQQACRSLHLVMEEEEELIALPSVVGKEMESSSWIAHMMEAQQKGKGVSVSLEYLQEPKQEFKVTTNCSNTNEQVSVGVESTAAFCGRRVGRKSAGDKRRTKAEKTISLPVLRQYFAGSLKDAAKSIGGQGATTFKSPTTSPCSQTTIVMSESQPLGLGASVQVVQEEAKHFAHQHLESLPPLPQSSTSVWNMGTFRVKATFGDEKIRFSLQPNWGFRDLQKEISRRFNLNEISNIQLKYLDDAREWVLLTCDADLEECKGINTSSQSQSRTIRLFLFHASPLNHANAFPGTSPSS
ncbi:Protein NLP2 [Glycine max]|nr:Protein NLP2 [Glycine max]